MVISAVIVTFSSGSGLEVPFLRMLGHSFLVGTLISVFNKKVLLSVVQLDVV